MAFAQARGLTYVVDVRLNPVSRRQGFSKRALALALEGAGLQYVHMPQLGNPRDNREGFADVSGSVGGVARRRYREGVLQREDATIALMRLRVMSAQGVAVMCFESDESTCHRELVLDAVGALEKSDLDSEIQLETATLGRIPEPQHQEVLQVLMHVAHREAGTGVLTA